MAYQTVSLNDFVASRPSVDGRFTALIDMLPRFTRQGPWLAGGSVRKFMSDVENKADYDIFFKSQEQCNQYYDELINMGAVEVQRNIFNRMLTLNGYVIQVIHHEFRNTLIQTMDRFDMTICQFGYDGTNLVWSEEAKNDVDNGELHFLGTTDPVYNLNRAFKYCSEGFKPADGEVKKILMRVAAGKASVKGGRKISGAGASSISIYLDDTFMPNGGSAFVGKVVPKPASAIAQALNSMSQAVGVKSTFA